MRWERCAAVVGFIHFSITQGLFPRTARATRRTQLSMRTAIHGLTIFEKTLVGQENCFLFACLQEMEYFCKPFQQQRKT